MKICPACKSQYSDDTLQFCLQDGTPLTHSAETDRPTVVLGESETVAAHGGGGRVNVPIHDPALAAWQQSQVTHVADAIGARKGSKTTTILIVGVLAIFVLLGIVGFGALLLWRNSQQSLTANVGNAANLPGGQTNTNYNAFPTQSGSPFVSPTSTRASVTPMPTVPPDTSEPPKTTDDSQVRTEVSQRVYGWKSSLESRDFNGYMSNYASTVDYYKRRGVGVGTVRADKARAFSLYSSMQVSVSNMSVSTDPTGDAATATFDKEWSFSGRDTSSGKVRSQLEFRLINGRWLITAERDLKVYYKR